MSSELVKTDYTAIAKRGHGESRIVQSSFKDLIPLRDQAGPLDLRPPTEDEIDETARRTQAAIDAVIARKTGAQNPKTVQGGAKDRTADTIVRYTPTAQMGDSAGKTRIVKIVQRQIDPMEPAKFKMKRIPRGPPSPPPPVLHSPPRKVTAAEQEQWRIPPAISNWKNPKGFTVPLDKRLAADGRSFTDMTVSDKFGALSSSLDAADRHAREEVKQRALMQQRLAEKEKLQKEENLRNLARQAREERANASRRLPGSYSDSDEDEQEEEIRKRDEARKERRQEFQKELRQSRMGTERKMQMLAREQNRDISEKVALGLAKPTQSGESMYDARLFNQNSGLQAGFNEDQHYDKPLFAAQDAISSIYRPTIQQDDGETEDATYDRLTKSGKFQGLGQAKDGFQGTDIQETREGPVQFEKDTADPFGIDKMINEVRGEKTGEKRYGMQDQDEPAAKRSRWEEGSD